MATHRPHPTAPCSGASDTCVAATTAAVLPWLPQRRTDEHVTAPVHFVRRTRTGVISRYAYCTNFYA